MSRWLILFDCDGTLVDSQHDIVAAMEHAFTHHGLVPPTRLETLSVVGLSVPQAIHTLAPAAPAEVQEALAREFRLGAPHQRGKGGRDNPLYPGAHQAVLRLAGEDDVVLGVATGKSRRGVKRLFDQHSWHDHFQTIQTADTNRSKPDPEMIVTAMSEVGVDPRRTIMIGDTSFDMMMARAAGVIPVGVTWGYHTTDEITRAGAHALVQSFDDLVALLARARR